MPYPTKYTRQYDFASYQNANPTRPLPGDKVNVDLDTAKASLAEVIDFLKTSIRADGKLANGSVGVNQLDATFEIGFSLPTTWEPGIAYTTDSTVFHADAFYKANVAHTSTDGFDESKWDLIVDFGAQAAAAAASAAGAATSETNAAASATASANSATSSAGSATAASNSATAASGSATTATTQAGNASTSATAASDSASAAATSETNAAASATAAAGSAADAAASAASITIASQAEAEAGTDNTKLMTPLRTAEAMSALAGATAIAVPPQGRLTLTSGVAVTTSDVTGAASVYFTPSGGNQVPIYDGTNTVPTTFSELTLALDSNAAHTNYQASGKNYDLFIINDAGTVRLGTGPKWDDGAVAGSNTARGTGAASTELELKNGFWTNKNAITIRFGSASGNTVSVSANRATYVGTIRMTADGQTEDSMAKRFVYNAYNQARRPLLRRDATATWTYSAAVFRQANANTANQCSYVAGLTGSSLSLMVIGIIINSTATVRVVYSGIGLDSTTVSSATLQVGVRAGDTTSNSYAATAYYEGAAQLGYHYAAILEKGNGTDTQTWLGISGDNVAGMQGSVFQ